MDKNTILDYVMNSPQNTNRAVLSSMLDSMGGGNSGSDDGGGMIIPLGTMSLGHIEKGTATASDTGVVISIEDAGGYDGILMFIKAQNDNVGYIGSISCILFSHYTETNDYEHDIRNAVSTSLSLQFMKVDSGGIKSNTVTSVGVYPYQLALTDGHFTTSIYAKYNATTTGVINNDFIATYYGLKLFETFNV